MGSFDAIQIGATGLNAQRRGVEIAGQNIANVNTEGYTRQRIAITSDAGPVTPAIHSTWSGTGLGVRNVEFERLRDAFVDRRTNDELAVFNELQTIAGAYASIEQVFNDPSDTGLSSVLADFLAAWDDVANQPDDVGARSQVLQRGETLAADIRQIISGLETLQEVRTTEVGAIVNAVNTAATQVANLNEAIASAKASGLNANELQDQRDLLLQQIIERVGGTVRHEDDGTATLFIGGTALVRDSHYVELEADTTGATADIVWALDARTASVGGEAKGLLQTINTLVPEHISQMNDVADALRTQVNALHTTGFDLNGAPGLDFFVMGADGIEVNPTVLADTDRVAAADTAGTLDGSVAQEIAEITGIDTVYREMIVRLGVSSQSAHRRVTLQEEVVAQVHAEQQSVSGVNLDEELSDLVRFQRAYEANSRFISAIDDLLNTLVNGTGRVGR